MTLVYAKSISFICDTVKVSSFLFCGITCNILVSTSQKRGGSKGKLVMEIHFYHIFKSGILFSSRFTGDIRELYKYESERQKHNMATMASIDGLYRLYSTNATPVVLLRSLGLSAVNMLSPLKVRSRETRGLYPLLGLLTGSSWSVMSVFMILIE